MKATPDAELDDEQLLDELAWVYARVALAELMAEQTAQVQETPCAAESPKS